MTTITVDDQSVVMYETQVQHWLTGDALWASTSGVIACCGTEGAHIIGSVDPTTGTAIWGGEELRFGTLAADRFRSAHQQAFGMESFALVQRARAVIERWKAQGKDRVIYPGAGLVYPIPPTWLLGPPPDDVCYPADSPEAIEALVVSMREGWKYE